MDSLIGFERGEDENEHDALMRHVAELSGAISTCWVGGTGDLEFDDSRAGSFMAEMEVAIEAVMEPYVAHLLGLQSIIARLAYALGDVTPDTESANIDLDDLMARAETMISRGRTGR